jgi:hypothetical protein
MTSSRTAERLALPASIGFGRPVLPPEVIDFHTGEITSAVGPSDGSGFGTKSVGTLGTWSR